jgi:hypothetical protein
MAPDSHRLSILTASEIDDLYGLPRFTNEDRRRYFDLREIEHKAAGAYIPAVAAHFILQLGFFKARQQFFIYKQDAVVDDLRHILERYFPRRDLTRAKIPSKPTRLSQQQVILRLMRYRLCGKAARKELERKAERTARLSVQPIFILREMLEYLRRQRIVAPAYKSLQDMVGRVLTRERDRISKLLQKALTPKVQEQFDKLLQADEYFYRIGAVRREPKDFSNKKLEQEIERRKLFQTLHDFAQIFLARAEISMDSRKYYASLVKFYTVYKLRRMSRGPARLYLLCFAYYRFRQINDNLIESFLCPVNQYEQEAKSACGGGCEQSSGRSVGESPCRRPSAESFRRSHDFRRNAIRRCKEKSLFVARTGALSVGVGLYVQHRVR